MIKDQLQAGAELCQAQFKLGIALPALIACKLAEIKTYAGAAAAYAGAAEAYAGAAAAYAGAAAAYAGATAAYAVAAKKD
jgi:hypothetical protein